MRIVPRSRLERALPAIENAFRTFNLGANVACCLKKLPSVSLKPLKRCFEEVLMRGYLGGNEAAC